MNPTAVASRHPVTAFIALTLVWSWTIWALLVPLVGRGGLSRDPGTVALMIAAIGGLGPSLSGLVLTRLLEKRAGFAALRARLCVPRAGRWWWALLLIPAVNAVTPLLRALAGTPIDLAAMGRFIGPGIALGFAAALMEEFGWRGFLLPRLLVRHGPARAALLVGVVWGGLWHGYADWFGVRGDGIVFWGLLLLLGPLLLTAWSFVITRVYLHTGGNLLMSILMHVSLSSSAFVLGQSYASGWEELAWTALSVAIAASAATALWRTGTPREAASPVSAQRR